MRRPFALVLLAGLVLTACSTWRPLDERADASAIDAGPADAGVDAATSDGG